MKAILFDLDGTLLPTDTDAFLSYYMKSVTRFMAPILPTPVVERLPEMIMASTYAMIANVDPSVSNEAAFWSDFLPRIGYERVELEPHFTRFYAESFPTLRMHMEASLPGQGRAIVEAAAAKGYDLVLATNPVFPRAAIEERMRWVGIDHLPWRLVTTYEEMHFCKPQPGYYMEICERIGRRPEECLMVGNDVDEDGVAAKIGMRLYLATDYLINRHNKPLDPNHSGPLSHLLTYLP